MRLQDYWNSCGMVIYMEEAQGHDHADGAYDYIYYQIGTGQKG